MNSTVRPAGVGQLALGVGDDRAHLLDPGVDAPTAATNCALGGQRDDVGQRRLAGAGRAAEHQRHRLVGLDQPPQRRAGAEQVLLADDLVERARPHRTASGAPGSTGGWPVVLRARRTAKSRFDATRGVRHDPCSSGASETTPSAASAWGPSASARCPSPRRSPAPPPRMPSDGARGAGRRGDPDRHRRRLLAATRPSSGTTRSWWPTRCARTGGTDVLVATKGGHTRRARPGVWTGRRPTSAGPARPRCGGCTSRRSACTSSTGPTRRRRGRSRWAALRSLSRRRPGADGRHLERGHRPDRRRPRDLRRRAGQRAEPVLARLALLGRRAGALRGARARLAALEPVRRGVAAGSLDATAPAFAEVADELGVSVYRVTLAWHLAQADVVLPIPGASRPAVDRRLGRRRRPEAHRRPARPPEHAACPPS